MTTRDVPRLLVLAVERIARPNLFLQRQRAVIETSFDWNSSE